MNLIYKDSPQLLQNILALFSHPFTPLPFKIWLLILLLACIFSQAKQDPPIAMQIYFRKDSAHRLMPIIVSITEHNCSTSSSSSIKANKLGPHVQCYDSIMQSIVFLSLSLPLLVRSGAGAHLKKVMQMLSYSYAVAALALLSAVSAQPQRGLPQPRYNSADAQAVILKQNFDLNPDGSYQHKWVESMNNK